MKDPKREIHDELRVLAKWFVRTVEQNIVKGDFVTDDEGWHTFFTLIRFPDEKIEDMRSLTIGPKVMAMVVSVDGNTARIEMAEVNGVSVTGYEYEINAQRSYSRADFVSYYVMKVPKSKSISHRSVFRQPVILGKSTRLIEIPLPSSQMTFGENLLGASQSVGICLKGDDEIGREVVERVVLN